MSIASDTLEMADVAVADVVQAASDALDLAASGIDTASSGIDAVSEYGPSRSTWRIIARVAALLALVAVAAVVWRKFAGSDDDESEFDPA